MILQSCDKNDEVAPEPAIRHVKFDEPRKVFYNNPVTLDINDDSKNDFSFTVDLFMNGPDVDQKYVAVSIKDARIKLLDEEAIAYNSGFTVGDVSVSDPGIWSYESGEIMTMTIDENDEVEFHGPWIDEPEAFLAISIRIDGAYHFGWIKLASDIATQSVLVVEYALHQQPGKMIETGQTE
jgi:hypothetical protein